MELEHDLVTVTDAAPALGISRTALDKRLAVRGIEVERLLVRGRLWSYCGRRRSRPSPLRPPRLG
jgi:hypothetical protein